MNQSSTTNPIKGRVVALDVTSNIPEHNNVVINFRGAIASKLLGNGLFQTITDSGNHNAEYLISINLTDIKEVSGVSRVMLGVLAGANKIAGNVNVVEAMTGQTIKSFSFVGESASHQMSGKSDIKDAIEKASEEIIKGLK